MNEHTHGHRAQTFFTKAFLLIALALVFADGALARTPQGLRPVASVQDAVRARIERERRGARGNVVFNDDAQRSRVSAVLVSVRGTGYLARGGRRDEFSYSGVFHTRTGGVMRVEYQLTESAGGGGGGQREVPRWLVGTFRGRNPSTRQQRRMLVTVEDNGRVSVVYGDGARENGSYSDRQLRIGSTFVWNVSRNGDGFRAQDDRTRRAEDFVRAGDASDDGGNDRVPRWAVGTFRGTTADGEAELTINRDGSVIATSIVNRTSFAGRFDNGLLTFDWGSFNVTREADGIRTIKVNDRNNQTYYRRVN